MRHGPIRFWDGIGGSWRASSMGQKRGYILADPKWIRQSSNSLSAWPKTIWTGAMTESWAF